MSTPENPLDQYYTHSYHHILLCCDTTAVAEALQATNELVTFQRSDEQNTSDDPFGKYAPRDFQGKGKYSIIINGMVDAEFSIKTVKWDTITSASGGTTGPDRFTTMAVEGSMTIEEPRGIKFMNVMAHVADFLDSDPSGLIFILKTIFIGYPAPGLQFNNPDTPDGGQVYDPITNIRPFLFTIYDITGKFEITGGTYDIAFAGINNGATKQKHIMQAAQQISINMNATKGYEGCDSKTLSGALCRLQTEINKIYDAHFDTVKGNLEKKGLSFNGRKVKYVIIAEEPYVIRTGVTGNGVPITKPNPAYVVTDFKSQNTDSGETGEAGIIPLGNVNSIESAIMQIVGRCPEAKKDLAESDKKISGQKSKWKPVIATTINATKEEYQVIFKLRRIQEPRADVIQKVLNRQNDSANQNDEDISRNLLTLDYFFTGQNVDILNMDIKMEMGLAFFQTLITTETIPSSQEAQKGGAPEQAKATGDTDGSVKATPKNESDGQSSDPIPVRKNTPIFFGTKFDDKTTKNTLNAKTTADFQQLLNRHAALENIESKVTIRGNPGLLNAMNKPPSEVMKHVNISETEADTGTDLFPYWETTPAIVKINIRMPSDGGDTDFSEPFWYQGFYHCWAINQEFNDGEFTQILNLLSLPISATKGDESQAEASKTDQGKQTDTQNTATNTTINTTTASTTTQSNVPSEDPAGVTAGGNLRSHTQN